ncbi:MAG: MFS transporter [Tepidisphaeraceae bacterium]
MATARRPLPRNVITLGWVSFFTDCASEMLYPIVAIFVTRSLGATPAILGLIDGVAEGGSSLLRWAAGAVSDRFAKRKPFVVAGYSISAVSKPLMGLAALAIGWPLFFGAKVLDRMGKSVRTSARDALIADSTPQEDRGRAFGVHRAMDTAGAVVGPLIAALLLWLVPGIRDHLEILFFVALAPGLASVLLAQLFIREITSDHVDPNAKPAPLWQTYPKQFWWIALAAGLFSLGNSSDSFLILRASNVGLNEIAVILSFVLYNVVYALTSPRLGELSDKVGRRPVVVSGWLVYALVYLGFAVTSTGGWIWPLMATYGLYQALTEGVSKAMIADAVPKSQRAGAIGMYYTIAGLAQLAGSVIAGLTWNYRIGPLLAPFAIGTAFALAGAAMLSIVSRPKAD